MPISNAYIVQYLLDGTSEVPAQIHWREKDAEQVGYVALVEDVDVILEPFYSRAGSRFVLRFRHDGDEFSIAEPAGGGWLGRKFSSEDERHLVRLFRGLIAAVVSQCALRRQRAEQNQDEIRERISRRLLFGQPETRQELSDAHRDRVVVGWPCVAVVGVVFAGGLGGCGWPGGAPCLLLVVLGSVADPGYGGSEGGWVWAGVVGGVRLPPRRGVGVCGG